MWAKEQEPTHRGIYTWTFKGKVFIRKNIENGPKRKVLSEEYLSKITKGDISLDIPTAPVQSDTSDSSMSPQLSLYYDVIIEQTKKFMKKGRRHF